MPPLTTIPIDQLLADRWHRVDVAYKRAFLAAACVSLLAFGFEMTNLTLHHDDLVHLTVQKPLVGYYLGRFVHAWLFFYGLQGHFAPFLHMLVGMLLMCTYGVVVAHFWGLRRTLDIALVASIVCVFPYMAQVYQYNSAMVAYPLAHLLAAAAVVISARSRWVSAAFAALLFFVAFSIYQAVLANAATIFLVWLLLRVTAAGQGRNMVSAEARAAGTVLLAVTAGGILHVLAVSALNIPFDSAQGADQAFSLKSRVEHGLQVSHAISEVMRGSRAFFVWPEAYLPQPLKLLQGLLLLGAALGCVLLPNGILAKGAAVSLLGTVVFSPRIMQFLHPQGSFHSLTLTAYALVIAAAVMVMVRSERTLMRSAAIVVTTLLVMGYVMQCNWISTVNHLNTIAHYTATTQILARLRSLPEQNWDGKTIAVVGSYDMPSGFPFRPATGVANEFLNPEHMTLLARLMRDEATFIKADATMPKVLEYAAAHKPWPAPESVALIDGLGVVLLSTDARSKASGNRAN